MTRWAVDVTGIDIDEDLKRENDRIHYTLPASRWSESLRDTTGDPDRHEIGHDDMGSVFTLTYDELLDQFEEQICNAQIISSLLSPPISLPASGTIAVRSEADSPKGRDIRVFCTFLNTQGKRSVINLQMKNAPYKGVDILVAFLNQAVIPDERISQRYSSNPRHYRLFYADEFTGEEDIPLQLDCIAQNFSCYAVQPLPAAKLFLFPQRNDLLPTVSEDIQLVVEIRNSNMEGKVAKRQALVPADMLTEHLEQAISNRLPGTGIAQGSLRIKYGPIELNINENYNFGAGCGQMQCPIASRTILSLHRFGVTEVVVNGDLADESQTGLVEDAFEDIVIKMDVEDAESFQQFEVIQINNYGARQQRILCVKDGKLYVVRLGAGLEIESSINGERLIEEIEQIELFPENAKYIEIEYTKASRRETDCFECTTAYNCAVLSEKLHILRREHRKRYAEKENETFMNRFFSFFARYKKVDSYS